MRRIVAVLATVVALVAASTGVVVWRIVGDAPPRYPEISTYSRGHLTRVGPYRFCNVRDLSDCEDPQTRGVLPVNDRNPVQLSVPTAIGRAPWRLLQVYGDPRDITESLFRPDTRLAVTIPTVDPHRGRLTGVVVQLLTLVQDENGELLPMPHAEWSVQTVWA